jgi:hypothetical protein
MGTYTGCGKLTSFFIWIYLCKKGSYLAALCIIMFIQLLCLTVNFTIVHHLTLDTNRHTVHNLELVQSRFTMQSRVTSCSKSSAGWWLVLGDGRIFLLLLGDGRIFLLLLGDGRIFLLLLGDGRIFVLLLGDGRIFLLLLGIRVPKHWRHFVYLHSEIVCYRRWIPKIRREKLDPALTINSTNAIQAVHAFKPFLPNDVTWRQVVTA